MDQQQLIEEAAREVLAHGDPNCLTDPHRPMDAIAAEMRRQRGA